MIHNRGLTLGSGSETGTLRAPEIRPGQDTMDPQEIAELIEKGFAHAEVRVLSDDNTHFQALVVATEFEGMRPLARHQLVYRTLGTLVGNEIHALSVTALTPGEWAARSGEGTARG